MCAIIQVICHSDKRDVHKVMPNTFFKKLYLQYMDRYIKPHIKFIFNKII